MITKSLNENYKIPLQKKFKMKTKRNSAYGLVLVLLFWSGLGPVGYAQDLSVEERAKKLFEARHKREEERARAAEEERAKQLAEAEEAARQKAAAEQKARQEAAEKAKREAEEKARKIAEDNRNYANYFKNGQVAEAKKDYKTAYAEYTKANNIYKSISSYLRLAHLYGEGLGVAKNEWKAIELRKQLVEWGYETADNYYQIARVYHFLVITEKANAEHVVSYYGKAIDKGHQEARKGLIEFAEFGLGREEEIGLNGRKAAERILSYDQASGYYYMGRYSETLWVNRPFGEWMVSSHPAPIETTLDFYLKAIGLGNNRAKAALIEFCFRQAKRDYDYIIAPRKGSIGSRRKQKAEERERAPNAIRWYQIAANHGSEEAAKRIQTLRKKVK